MTSKKLVLLLGLALGAALLSVDTALAQCSMCRTALEQNGELAGGFNRGILFLLGMPYLVFVAVGGAWYWKRRQRESREGLRRESSWRRDLSPSPR